MELFGLEVGRGCGGFGDGIDVVFDSFCMIDGFSDGLSGSGTCNAVVDVPDENIEVSSLRRRVGHEVSSLDTPTIESSVISTSSEDVGVSFFLCGDVIGLLNISSEDEGNVSLWGRF